MKLEIDQYKVTNEFQIPTEAEIKKSLNKEIGQLLDQINIQYDFRHASPEGTDAENPHLFVLNCEPIKQEDDYVNIVDCEVEADFVELKSRIGEGNTILQHYPKKSMFNFKAKMIGFAEMIKDMTELDDFKKGVTSQYGI